MPCFYPRSTCIHHSCFLSLSISSQIVSSDTIVPVSLGNLATALLRYTDTLINPYLVRVAQVQARNAKRVAAQIVADNARAASVATALAAAQSSALAAVQAFIQSLPEPANFVPFLAAFVAAQIQEAVASVQKQAAISKANKNAVERQNQVDQVSLNDSIWFYRLSNFFNILIVSPRPQQTELSEWLPMPWYCIKSLNLD
jgi:hypothetical protein